MKIQKRSLSQSFANYKYCCHLKRHHIYTYVSCFLLYYYTNCSTNCITHTLSIFLY